MLCSAQYSSAVHHRLSPTYDQQRQEIIKPRAAWGKGKHLISDCHGVMVYILHIITSAINICILTSKNSIIFERYSSLAHCMVIIDQQYCGSPNGYLPAGFL